MAHDVFISYSAEDRRIAEAVCATLERNQIRCWIAPRDVRPGQDYAEALIQAINQSRIMVLVLSASSNSSPQVTREVERAASKGLPIIPFRIEDVPLSQSMEYFLSKTHWLDALTRPLEKHLQQLAETARPLLTTTGGAAQVEGEVEASVAAPTAEAAVDKGLAQPTPPRRAFESVKGWVGRPMVRLALGIGAAVAVAIFLGVLIALLSGDGEGDSGPAALVPSPSRGTPTVTPGTPTVTPGTPTVTPGTPTVAPSTPTIAPSTPTAAPSTPTVPPGTPTVVQDTSPGGPAPPMGEANEYAISASPGCVAPGGRVEATWTAVDKGSWDVIALFPAAARNDKYRDYEWDDVNTIGGRFIFPAPSTPGEYEVRLLRSGNHLAVSNSITVQDGCPTRSVTAELEGYSASASPECVAPGDRLEVTWTAVDKGSWDVIALFPAAARNDKYRDYEWDDVGTAGGSVIFPAPSTPGEYEFRLVRDGTHLAVSQPITVSNDC